MIGANGARANDCGARAGHTRFAEFTLGIASCAAVVAPQVQIVPSTLKAPETSSPSEAGSDFQPLPEPTCHGTLLMATLPLPSWPEVLAPHAHSVPSRAIAIVWDLPQATLSQPPAAPSRVGTFLAPLVPAP